MRSGSDEKEADHCVGAGGLSDAASGGPTVDSCGVAGRSCIAGCSGVAGCGGVVGSGGDNTVVVTEGVKDKGRVGGDGFVPGREEQQVGERRRLVSPSPSLSNSSSQPRFRVHLAGTELCDDVAILYGISG
jgi:hypothetical protein